MQPNAALAHRFGDLKWKTEPIQDNRPAQRWLDLKFWCSGATTENAVGSMV